MCNNTYKFVPPSSIGVLIKLNTDVLNRRLKQDSCLIGWLKHLKAKSLALSRRALEKQLEKAGNGRLR